MGAGVPSIGVIGQSAVASLQRFGLELPASVRGKLAELVMIPDFVAGRNKPSLLHELVAMGGPVRSAWWISITSH
jgi:hypothetical protein